MIVLSLLATVLVVVWTILCSAVSIISTISDRSGRLYLRTSKLWSQVLLLLYGVRLKVIGGGHIRPDVHYVYVSNHSSYMDIPVLLAGVNDNIRLTYRSTLARTPIWGWALRFGPFLMIDRSSPMKAQRTIQSALALIRDGASIQLFPEGTRTPDGELKTFKRGAFNLAYEAKVPIIPVAIKGIFEVLPRNRFIPRWGRHVELHIGEPIEPHVVPESESRAEELRLMRLAEQRVREMLKP